jgi:hypothetical protein
MRRVRFNIIRRAMARHLRGEFYDMKRQEIPHASRLKKTSWPYAGRRSGPEGCPRLDLGGAYPYGIYIEGNTLTSDRMTAYSWSISPIRLNMQLGAKWKISYTAEGSSTLSYYTSWISKKGEHFLSIHGSRGHRTVDNERPAEPCDAWLL